MPSGSRARGAGRVAAGAPGLCPEKSRSSSRLSEFLRRLQSGSLWLVLAVGENSSSEPAAGTILLALQSKDEEEAFSMPLLGVPSPPWVPGAPLAH